MVAPGMLASSNCAWAGKWGKYGRRLPFKFLMGTSSSLVPSPYRTHGFVVTGSCGKKIAEMVFSGGKGGDTRAVSITKWRPSISPLWPSISARHVGLGFEYDKATKCEKTYQDRRSWLDCWYRQCAPWASSWSQPASSCYSTPCSSWVQWDLRQHCRTQACLCWLASKVSLNKVSDPRDLKVVF